MEIWKEVKDYYGLYLISNKGNVYSLIRNKVLKKNIGNSGYYYVNLYKDKKSKSYRIHQLVAIHYLNHKPNGFNLVVDHIDNNKLNNEVSNLQLITNRANSFKDKKSKSGHYNIYKNNSSWIVRMRINGVKKTFGTFKNINDAILRRDFIINNL